MAETWTNLPLTGAVAVDLQDWPNLLAQIPRAIRKREMAAGAFAAPQCSRVWESGTVPGGATAQTFTDGTKTWDTTKTNPWGRVNDDQAPGTWFIVFDNCDPDKCAKVPLLTFNNTGTVTYDLRDYVAAGFIVMADLPGTKYDIIRGDNGEWWHEREMERPNDYEWAVGTIRSYHDDAQHPATQTNPTHTTIKDDAKSWAKSEHVGRVLLVYGDDGPLHRVTITANDAQTVTFASQTWTPAIGTNYLILTSGQKGWPGRAPTEPFAFYRGAKDSFYTHKPDDSRSNGGFPATTIGLPLDDGLGSCGVTVQAFDRDVVLDDPLPPGDFLCGAVPGAFYSPDFNKTMRAWQIRIENASSNGFVENKSYDGLTIIPYLNPARLFQLASINTFTATTTSVPGGATSNSINFGAVAFPYTPIEICWSLTAANGDVAKFGYGLASTTTQLTSRPRTDGLDVFDNATDTGLTLVISLGWTRFYERRFRQMWALTGFVADSDGMAPIDPPIADPGTGLGAGIWRARAASTKYLDSNAPQSAFADAKGYDVEGPDSFAGGDLARYVGDNAYGPSIRNNGGSFIQSTEILATYYDGFFVGVCAPAHQSRVTGQLSGTAGVFGGAGTGKAAVVAATTTQLTCSTQNLWDLGFLPGEENHVETGTATSGSTTSLTDSTKLAGAAQWYWKNARFQDAGGAATTPYLGFAVEVLISGTDFSDETGVVEKRLITGGSEAGVTVSWTPALSASANGKKYRIREPHYRLNNWKGRTLLLTDGVQTATTTVSGHDDVTLFFPAIAFVPTAYSITDPVTGGVYKWNAGTSRWDSIPAGTADVVRTGVLVPQPFHADPRENLPFIVKRYGRFCPHDIVDGNPALVNEMYTCLTKLLAVKGPLAWSYKASAVASAEWNERRPPGGAANTNGTGWPGTLPGHGPPYTFAEFQTAVEAHWAEDNLTGEDVGGVRAGPADGIPDWDHQTDGTAPFCHEQAGETKTSGPTFASFTYSETRLYAYPTAGFGVPHCPSPFAVSFYTFADVPLGHNDGDACPDKYDFDANGDGVQYRKWSLMSTAAGQSTSPVYGTKIGSLSHPNDVGDPVPGASGSCAAWRGYIITDQCSVRVYDFS